MNGWLCQGLGPIHAALTHPNVCQLAWSHYTPSGGCEHGLTTYAGDIMTVQATTTSPCVKVCRLGEDGVCVGCWRTLDEIARWTGMSESEKQRLVGEVLPERRMDRAQEVRSGEPQDEHRRG